MKVVSFRARCSIFASQKKTNLVSKDMENIDYKELGFGYVKTDYNVRCRYADGAWGVPYVSESEEVSIPIAASCLHYGQEAFEGMKAFRGVDGKVRIFRMRDGARRLQSSCRGIVMPELPEEMFCGMVKQVVELNAKYIPPYESGAALYIRPLLIGTTAQVGVKPAKEYLFIVFVTPVGPYFPNGFGISDFVIMRDYDRAAPLGTGRYKVGGNYAAGMLPNHIAHKQGYAGEFYLDAKEKRFIDECGAANFFGIKDGAYITPASSSILPSITNKTLMQLARGLGLRVEQRPVAEEELAELEEAGACGTAAVISPIGRIDDPVRGVSYQISKDGQPGPWSTKLYKAIRAIQYGEAPDTHAWTTLLDI